MRNQSGKQEYRTVHDEWLWERAGALETKLLKKYKISYTRGTIEQRFYKCIEVYYSDLKIMDINYTKYREICKEIEREISEKQL